jgi:nitrite reductase/ring-hydroxylating ferredoxin subunit
VADLGPPTGKPIALTLEGSPVLVCSVRGTLFAYRDECAVCHVGLGESTLDGAVLTCACGASYDVQHAGAGIDAEHHLDPLPLLNDSNGVRISVPKAAVPSAAVAS